MSPSAMRIVAAMGPRNWLLAIGIAVLSGLVIAIPTALAPNPLFTRMTPARPLDYVFLAVSSLLIGLTFAIRPAAVGGAASRPLAGGLVTYFAVGCPVCNKIVVALLGTSGALAYFAPLQPVLGVAAIALLILTLRQRVRALNAAACSIPSRDS